MKHKILLILFFAACINAYTQTPRYESLFDDNWKFYPGDVKDAEKPSFNDKSWRDIDLPHDWSIEKLPGQEPGKVVGPFHKESLGTTATGYTLGGTGWYRKTFVLSKENFTTTILNFDGVYMNCVVWVNGKEVGTHPYGYTAFQFDITKYLQPAGKPNVVAVKVRNEGKNSRWYSGSGIYRHVWLIRKNSVHIPHDGVFVTTENISANEAIVKVSAAVTNLRTKKAVTKLSFEIIGPDGKISQQAESQSR
jgi:beta-galactosidase